MMGCRRCTGQHPVGQHGAHQVRRRALQPDDSVAQRRDLPGSQRPAPDRAAEACRLLQRSLAISDPEKKAQFAKAITAAKCNQN